MRADYQQEATERAQRVLARDMAKAMKEQQRIAAEELDELRRQEEEQRRQMEEESRRREEEQRRQMRQIEEESRRREEDLKRQQRRREEQIWQEQEDRRQRLEDEAEEEKAAIRKQAAGAKAKLLVIEQLQEEMDEESEEGESESALPSEPEIGAIEKASAFVGELVNIQHDLDQQPKRNEAESIQLGEQNPRGGVVVDSEVVPIPSAQTVLDWMANNRREQLRDPVKTVSFRPVSQGGGGGCSKKRPTRVFHHTTINIFLRPSSDFHKSTPHVL